MKYIRTLSFTVFMIFLSLKTYSSNFLPKIITCETDYKVSIAQCKWGAMSCKNDSGQEFIPPYVFDSSSKFVYPNGFNGPKYNVFLSRDLILIKNQYGNEIKFTGNQIWVGANFITGLEASNMFTDRFSFTENKFHLVRMGYADTRVETGFCYN